MNVYPSDDGRAALIRLERGSDVLQSLDEAARELGIYAGTVQAIGAVSELVVGYYKQDEKRYVTIPFPEPLPKYMSSHSASSVWFSTSSSSR
jgi:predicted DNA-binding protein with PD1-like motif